MNTSIEHMVSDDERTLRKTLSLAFSSRRRCQSPARDTSSEQRESHIDNTTSWRVPTIYCPLAGYVTQRFRTFANLLSGKLNVGRIAEECQEELIELFPCHSPRKQTPSISIVRRI